jgi:broad specificity phosphatase PhoE
VTEQAASEVELRAPTGAVPAKRLVLLRHGRTAWNHERRAQGHADVPLDHVGRRQARAVAPLIAGEQPSSVWSSDLARAKETAALVAEECGLRVEEDERLREFSVGERQGLTWEQSVDRFPWIAEGVGLGERLSGIPGAESDEDVRARIVPAVEECAERLAAGQTGVVVSHGAALKIALAGLLGWDDSVTRTLSVLGNCQWATVLVPARPGVRRLVAYGVGDFASREGIG